MIAPDLCQNPVQRKTLCGRSLLDFLSLPLVVTMPEVSNALTLVATAALCLSADAKFLQRSSGRILGATIVSMGTLARLSCLVVGLARW